MSFLFGMLIGCGLGAVGHHFYLQYKLNGSFSKGYLVRQEHEMVALFQQDPYLMNLIRSNINDPEYKKIREFFVVDKHAIMNSSTPRLRYDLSDETLALVKKLEQLGYIERLEHDSLLYRMEEEFIKNLISFNPAILSELAYQETPQHNETSLFFS